MNPAGEPRAASPEYYDVIRDTPTRTLHIQQALDSIEEMNVSEFFNPIEKAVITFYGNRMEDELLNSIAMIFQYAIRPSLEYIEDDGIEELTDWEVMLFSALLHHFADEGSTKAYLENLPEPQLA